MYNAIAAKTGNSNVSGANAADVNYVAEAANDLLANKGKSLVVAGSNDPAVQVLVNGINAMLGNYGTTINPNAPVHYRQGNDQDMANFAKDLNGGNYWSSYLL